MLTQAKLGTELANMAPEEEESNAINNLAGAWEKYFELATVTGVSIVPGSLASALSAMKAVLVGISVDGAGAAKFQAGIQAFWTTVVASSPTIWITAPPLISATPPPSLGTIAAALQPVFDSNKTGKLALPAAANAIAAVLHPIQLGGLAVLGPPPPGGTSMPIL